MGNGNFGGVIISQQQFVGWLEVVWTKVSALCGMLQPKGMVESKAGLLVLIIIIKIIIRR